jgi:phosphoribosylanthranilate isomerase
MEVKVCGITNLDDARVALEAGADYLGFVFYAKSPRAVVPEVVTEILSKLSGNVRGIGVFVNEAPAAVERIVRDCGLYGAQIHGDEQAKDFKGFSFPVWRALWIEDGVAFPDPGSWEVERYVIDAAAPGQYGGSGQRADWDVARELARQVPVMLAGGLNVGNVAKAMEAVRPMGVDVSSGVERSPGKKDHEKVTAFVAAAKGVGTKAGLK